MNPVAATEYDSGWLHFPTQNNLLSGYNEISTYHQLPSVRSEDELRLDFHDPDNEDSVFDLGALFIGRTENISGKLVGFSAIPGPIGFPKIHEFTLEYLTEAEAFGTMHEVFRRLGYIEQSARSRGGQIYFDDRAKPGVFIADEISATYEQERAIYGVLEGPAPIPRQIGQVWQTRFRVVEVT